MSQSQSSGESIQFELPNSILSRRAVFNSQQDVVAYELQLDTRHERQVGEREESITAELLLRLLDTEIDNYVDRLKILIPISKSYVQAGLPLIENAHNVIFEIPEGLLDESDKVRFLNSTSRDDIRFAWVNPKPDSLNGELLSRIEFVKLDVSIITPDQVISMVKFYKGQGIKLIADQVTSPSMFEICKQAGFDYFMGYFFCMPKVIDQKQIPASKVSVLHLICELQNSNTSIDRIREIVEKDVSLSYRILRYINSPLFQFSKKIESIKNAIIVAGLNTIKTLSVIVAHSKIVDKPPELFKVALMRARMGETLGELLGFGSDTLFMLGLFTTLDALTDKPMEDITALLPLSDETRNILNNYQTNPQTPTAEVLKAIVSFEKGDWESFDQSGFDIQTMRNHYWQAASWVGSVLELLNGPHLSEV